MFASSTRRNVGRFMLREASELDLDIGFAETGTRGEAGRSRSLPGLQPGVWVTGGAVRYAVVASHGVWRSLVACFVRDEEVVGSNPATPTV